MALPLGKVARYDITIYHKDVKKVEKNKLSLKRAKKCILNKFWVCLAPESWSK